MQVTLVFPNQTFRSNFLAVELVELSSPSLLLNYTKQVRHTQLPPIQNLEGTYADSKEPDQYSQYLPNLSLSVQYLKIKEGRGKLDLKNPVFVCKNRSIPTPHLPQPVKFSIY